MKCTNAIKPIKRSIASEQLPQRACVRAVREVHRTDRQVTDRKGGSSTRAPERTGSRGAEMNIVFVCTSNTCRSPVAELFAVEWFKRRLKLSREEQEQKGVKIQSAAITDAFEKPGSPASANAVKVMKEYQIDLSKHRSQMLTEQMCAEADFVVCLSSGHTYKVVELFPSIKERSGVLCVLPRDVPDPWHMPYDTYMENVAQVEELVREFLEKNITWD